MRYLIPGLRLPSITNTRVHWRVLARWKQDQRASTFFALTGSPSLHRNYHFPLRLPLVVVITRVGPRRMDDDNLQGACKYVRDAIAAVIGVDDGSRRYTWVYRQRIGKYAVQVDIKPRPKRPTGHLR